MKILVNDACGFIGSHQTEYCCELGYDATAFVHDNSNNAWGWLDSSSYKKEMEIISGDIRDYHTVSS